MAGATKPWLPASNFVEQGRPAATAGKYQLFSSLESCANPIICIALNGSGIRSVQLRAIGEFHEGSIEKRCLRPQGQNDST